MRLRRARDVLGMGGEQDRRAEVAVQPGQELQHGGAIGRVEVAGRFIGDDQRRPVHQGARDGRALRFAARHLLGIVGEAVG